MLQRSVQNVEAVDSSHMCTWVQVHRISWHCIWTDGNGSCCFSPSVAQKLPNRMTKPMTLNSWSMTSCSTLDCVDNVCQGLLPKGECHHWQVFFLLKRFFLLSAQPNVRLASNFQQDLLLFGQWFQAFCYLVASYPFKVTKDFSKWLSWCRPGLNLPGGFFVHSICWRAFQHYKCW